MLKKCRICNSTFKSFLSLGDQPCADTFLKSKKDSINLKKLINNFKISNFYDCFQKTYEWYVKNNIKEL